MALPVAAIGIGALALLAMGRKGKSTSGGSVPASGGPGSGPGGSVAPAGGGGIDSKTVNTLVGSAIGLGTQVIGGAIAKSTATTAEVAAQAAVVGASGGSISGLVVEAIGGSLIVVGIILAVVMQMAVDAYASFQSAVQNFLMNTPRVDARSFFESFMKKYTVAASASSTRVNLPPATIRQVVLTGMYLEYLSGKARNDALLNFYTWAGWDAARMSQVCLPSGGYCTRVVPDYWAANWAAQVARSPVAPNFNPQYMASRALWTSTLSSVTGGLQPGQPGFIEVTAPTSLGEMQSAAATILGDQFGAAIAGVEFIGKLSALCWASVQGYGTFYPGDQSFTETLANVMVGWPVSYATKTTAGNKAVTAFWATDPRTGNSFDIAGVRAWQLNVAAPQPQAALHGFGRAGFARFGGRRFGRFGDSSQCIGPDGSFVLCPPDQGPPQQLFAPRGANSNVVSASTLQRMQEAAQPRGGLSLPMVAVGAGALFLWLRRH